MAQGEVDTELAATGGQKSKVPLAPGARRLRKKTLEHPAGLAQLVEQLPCKHQVAGSTPAAGTISHRLTPLVAPSP